MKRLPVIRHLRYFYLRWQVARHYDGWMKLGYLPVNAAADEAVLAAIWRGEM